MFLPLDEASPTTGTNSVISAKAIVIYELK
jgi:hypothetical protein